MVAQNISINVLRSRFLSAHPFILVTMSWCESKTINSLTLRWTYVVLEFDERVFLSPHECVMCIQKFYRGWLCICGSLRVVLGCGAVRFQIKQQKTRSQKMTINFITFIHSRRRTILWQLCLSDWLCIADIHPISYRITLITRLTPFHQFFSWHNLVAKSANKRCCMQRMDDA